MNYLTDCLVCVEELDGWDEAYSGPYEPDVAYHAEVIAVHVADLYYRAHAVLILEDDDELDRRLLVAVRHWSVLSENTTEEDWAGPWWRDDH